MGKITAQQSLSTQLQPRDQWLVKLRMTHAHLNERRHAVADVFEYLRTVLCFKKCENLCNVYHIECFIKWMMYQI